MKPAKLPPIVPPDKINDVKTALRHISDALPVIPKLEACGVDCTEYKQTLAHYEKHLNNILKTFTATQ
jgi:hypothetical protein